MATVYPLRPQAIKATGPLPSPAPQSDRPAPPRFGRWAGWKCIDGTVRINRPLLAVTVGLKMLSETREHHLQQRVERWAVDEAFPRSLLGEGKYAKILPFVDKLTGKPLAAKICKDPSTSDLSLAEKERNLLHLCQSVRHIIRFYGGVHMMVNKRSNLVLVMERVPSDLSIVLSEGRQMPFHEIMTFFKQFLEFHIDLSQLGVVHGDLTPYNIMWDGKLLKVYDFGHAQSVKTVRSNSGRSIQTLNFRAPEVLLGKDYDCQADLWSIGCIVFEVLTGGRESFVEICGDGPDSELESLGLIRERIGLPSDGYFEGARIPLAKIPSCKGRVMKLTDATIYQLRRRGVSLETSQLFLELLKRIICWENRIDSREALALCEEILRRETKLPN